jgi:dihydrofolate reductase
LKDQPDGNLVVSGSITLVRSLLAENLLDQLGLMIHPLVLGSGKRLLEAVNGSKNLELVGSKVFSSGVVSLTYRPAADGQDAAEPERQGR